MAESALRRPPQVSAADWLKTLPPAARWVLHGDAQARARAAPVWGVGFSETACRATRSGARATLWLGPDEYLLLDLAAREESSLATAAAIEEALRDTPHALVDVSHRQFALEVSGPLAEVILRGACPLDLAHKPISDRHVHAHAAGEGRHNACGAHAKMRSTWRSGARSRAMSADCCTEIAREFSPASDRADTRFAALRLLSSRDTSMTQEQSQAQFAGGLRRSTVALLKTGRAATAERQLRAIQAAAPGEVKQPASAG